MEYITIASGKPVSFELDPVIKKKRMLKKYDSFYLNMPKIVKYIKI